MKKMEFWYNKLWFALIVLLSTNYLISYDFKITNTLGYDILVDFDSSRGKAERIPLKSTVTISSRYCVGGIYFLKNGTASEIGYGEISKDRGWCKDHSIMVRKDGIYIQHKDRVGNWVRIGEVNK